MSLNNGKEGKSDIPGFLDEVLEMGPSGGNPHEINTSFRRMIIRSMADHGLVPDDNLLFGLDMDADSPDESTLIGIAFSQQELDTYVAYLDEEFLSGIGGRGELPGKEMYLDTMCLQRVARALGRDTREVYDAIIKVKVAKGLCPAKV